MFRNVQGGTASGRSPFVALWQREVVADCLAFGVVVESLQRGAEEEKAQHDEDFAEQLVRLPHSHFCYTPPEHFLWREKFWHPHKEILFGSFNNFAKLNEDILLLWKRILERVPGSRLLLKNSNYRTWTLRRIKDRVRHLGFPMDRVMFEGVTGDYFDRYADVDILLDTYPYTGGGTTCDALICGVPVITKYGSRHGTRFSYSLLANLGLEGLAAASDEEYVEKAVALAKDPELLAVLHEKIPSLSPCLQGVAEHAYEIGQGLASGVSRNQKPLTELAFLFP